MKRVSLAGITGLAGLVLAIVALGPVSAEKLPEGEQGGRPLSADLTGGAEIPPGDPDGTGFASVTLNPGQGTVCFNITVENIATATLAHIHRGDSTVAGPPVVNFNVPVNGLSGCVSADAALIKEIMKNPSDFYVNVHNADFPSGAVRGQLE